MDQVITFDKSLQERFREYDEILSDNISSVKSEWSSYLEAVVCVDCKGWQAIWKIPRTTCETLKIPYPSMALVLALDVRVKDLVALVRVLALQDDHIDIPEKHYVPLVELWVTEGQDKSIVLYTKSTANAIDALRFFYRNIFMPWNVDDFEVSDLKTKHLLPRLRLYYDMKNGNIPKTTAEHITSLLTEGRRLQAIREKLEKTLIVDSESEDDRKTFHNSKSETGISFEKSYLEKQLNIHVRLMEIKNAIEILEDPLLRKVVIKRQNELYSNETQVRQHTYVVFDEGKPDEYLEFLDSIPQGYSDVNITFAQTLISALEVASPDSTIFLKKATHEIKSIEALANGGKLCGVQDRDSTIVIGDVKDVMFDFSGGNIEITNLSINAKKPECAILIRHGQVTLKNVKIIGNGQSYTQQGIIILSGAKLELVNCEIEGFATGIVGNSGSSITMKNCDIHNLNLGLRIYDNCFVDLEKTIVHDCNHYGIVFETNNDIEKSYGGFEALKMIPHMKLDNINGQNNSWADVAIMPNLKTIADLFTNPDLDPTIIEDDDDVEMDECNVTVIEADQTEVN